MALRLFVLGATGNIGSRVLDVALSRGHRVTAFVRSPHKITRNDASLSVIGGDPLSKDALARALPGHDAVLSSIGPAPRDALAPSTLMAESAASTVAAMTVAGVKRLVIVSAAVLFPGRGLSFRFFQWLLRHHARDLVAMEAVVRATPLDWTIGRPPRLVKTPDESYRCAKDALPSGASSVSFRAVAAFLVDCAETQAYEREVMGLATQRNAGTLRLEPRSLNGRPAVVFHRGDEPFAALLLAVADGRIHRVFFHADPARLRHLAP